MKISCAKTARQAIHDWDTLGAAINVKSNVMAYVLHQRDSMQHRIRLGKRTVYKSDDFNTVLEQENGEERPQRRRMGLHTIQERIGLLVEPLLDELPGNEAVYSYRRGTSPVAAIKSLAGAKVLIATDVKGFYDHIFIRHIEGALVDCGFSHLGGRLIARYCVVRRGNMQTLQQGCPASPALSNLVGYKYIDVPVQAWLKENLKGVEHKYVRYCDNVELFIYGDMPEGFAQKYKEAVKGIMRNAGFRTHDWATVSDSHPKKNQRFLGVVLNHRARVEKGMIDSLRATLFNLCLSGLSREQVVRFLQSVEKMPVYDSYDEAVLLDRLMHILGGKVAYVSSVNDRHGRWLKKLMSLARLLSKMPAEREKLASAYSPAWKEALLRYKDDTQDIVGFISGAVAGLM